MKDLLQYIIRIKQQVASKLSVGTDKVDHFTVGFVLGLFSVVNIWLGISLGIAFGIGKEVYDYYNQDKHTPDVWDAIATVLGTALAVAILVLV